MNKIAKIMKHFKPLFFILLASVLLGVSCKENTPPDIITEDMLTLRVSPEVNGAPFELNKWYTTPSGQEYMLEQFKVYLSNVELLRSDNSTVLLEPIVLAETNSSVSGSPQVGLSFDKSNIQIGKYKGLRLGVGVSPDISSADKGTYDPSQYTTDHPLSEVYGMTWAWAGYKHMVMQGKYKTPGGVTGDINYHIALDTFYVPTNLTGDILVRQDQSNTANISIDLNRFFEPQDAAQKIDLSTEASSHSDANHQHSMELAKKVSTNLAKALELK